MGFVTKCPECGEGLELYDFEVLELRGVYIQEDGFDLSEAKTLSTTEERVKCYACDYEGDLETTDD